MYLKLHNKHKLDVIAHALTRCGITIWHGIPEQIVEDLHTAGYKIKKRKNFKKVAQEVDPRRIPAAVVKSKHDREKDIYL